MVTRSARGLGEAVIDAAVAGLVVGAVESVLLATRGAATAGEWPRFVIAAGGLAVVPLVLIGAVVVAAMRLIDGHPRVAAIGRALGRPGVARVETLAAAAVGAVALAAVWWIGFAVVAFAVGAFKAHRPIAMLSASVTAAAALAALGISVLVGPPVMRWCGRRAALVRVTSGAAGTALALGLVTVAIVATDRVVTTLAPAWDPVPAYLRVLALAAVIVVAVARPARRLGRRGAAAVGVLALAVAVAAPLVIARDPVTRGVVMSRGVFTADAVAMLALAWLGTPADGPRFLWVHLLDPHQPYETPSDTPRFAGPLGHYDAEIASADAAVGRIIAALDPARTIVVVTADHGEAFLDHHQRFHGSTLHEEELHVPLVVAAPGLATRTITPSVSHLDLAPTLLDLVGLGTPAGMQGQSLRAALHGAPLSPRVLVAASKPSRLSGRSLVAAYDGRTKIIRDLDAWTVEVYDLATDPGERAPRRHGAEVARMIQLLDAATTAELATLPAMP